MRHALAALIGTFTLADFAVAAPQQSAPVFRTAVDRVTVTTMVQDRHGRPVTDLTRDNFELFDGGVWRPITEFRSEAAPLSIALLMDFSGSMALADRRSAARTVASDVMGWLRADLDDQVGLFVFDKNLTELAPFGSSSQAILDGLFGLRPFGMTSLFDAIAETGRMLAHRGGTHRAIIALTDGGDNASTLTSTQVSAIASSIDVPVYIVIVSPTADRAGRGAPDETGLDAARQGRLSDLARWTGGQSFVASSPERSRAATRDIVTELRHQYVIVFAPDPRPGWHGIEIRTHLKDLVVRARSGYVVLNHPDGEGL